jgi:hypothetical protein
MRLILSLIVFVLAASAAVADDWTVVKLRGQVLQLEGGEWHPLERGDVVPDSRVIRTLRARVTLVRGAETVELGPDTQVQIFDEVRRNAFTTVKQYFGTVEVEAEARNVEHFAVQTPLLVAVVKGTRFVVVSGEDETVVGVKRGHVFVENRDSRSRVTLSPGQSVSRHGTAELVVTGRGRLPLVVGKDGMPVGIEVPPGLMMKEGQLTEKQLKELLKAEEKAAKEAEREAKEAEKEAKEEEKEAKAAKKGGKKDKEK